MRTVLSVAFVLAILCPVASPQTPTPAKDDAALQALLEEVHKLRQDLQAVAATTQRAQILLHRLRIQMDVVAHANEHLEEVRRQIAQAKFQHAQITNQLKQREENVERAPDQAARDEAQQEIAQLKNWLEQFTATESDNLGKEVEYANELRIEQQKLDDLQAQLDRLDKALEIAALHPGQK